MDYEYFISHASEDKDLIARPLAHTLRSAEFSVWYDEFSLRVGDRLLSSIDNGLRTSEYGVVILSPSFFAKKWPQQELAGLVAIERGDVGRILPVWHRIDSQAVASYSPLLADRIAVSTDRGLYAVCEELVKASYPDRLDNLPISTARMSDDELEAARSVLSDVLGGGGSARDVLLLLSAYHSLLEQLVGYRGVVVPGHALKGAFTCDFVVLEQHGITGPMAARFVVLGTTSDDSELELLVDRLLPTIGTRVEFSERPYNDYLGHPYAGEYVNILEAAVSISDRVLTQTSARETHEHSQWNAHMDRPSVWTVSLLLIIGRRERKSSHLRRAAAARFPIPVDIMSYERLLDVPGN